MSSTLSVPTPGGSPGKRGEPHQAEDNPRPSKMARLDVEDIAATVSFTLDGRTFCSRGVQPPQEGEPTVERQASAFDKLPPGLLTAIFEEACSVPLLEHLDGGLLSCAFPCGESTAAFEKDEKARRKTLWSIAAVCKQFRKICVPLIFTLAAIPNSYDSEDDAPLDQWLSSALPLDPTPTSRSSDSDEEEEGETSEESRPPSPVDDPSNPEESIGSRVRTLVFKHAVTGYESLGRCVAQCPNLTSLYFTSELDYLADSQLRELARKVSPNLRHLRGLYLMRNGSGTAHDTVLSLINYTSKLETLTFKNLQLPAPAAARLLFIFRLNARLRPPGQSDYSGIVTLSFGVNSSISRILLEGLHEAAPNLRHLHLEPGCVLGDDSLNENASNPEFDLTAFVAKIVARLETLTFICTSSMRVRGSLERLPTACPNLVAAYIRADQVSYPFFRQFVESQYSDSTNANELDASVDGYAESIEDARITESSVLPMRRRSPLRLLRLQHSHNSSKPKDGNLYVELDSRKAIDAYAKLAVQAEEAGIVWPADTSQKDLLMRLDWMVKAAERESQEAAQNQ